MKVREIIGNIESSACLPAGTADRFAGYGVIGLPFRSGDVLAMRRFPASSIGPAYTSVWHRTPGGKWTFYSTVPPEQGCARYFGSEIFRNVLVKIEVVWTGSSRFRVTVGDAIKWEMTLSRSPLCHLINAVAGLIPESWWSRTMTLKMMGHAARIALDTGRLNLAGRTPNGYEFIANPRQVWLIDSSSAVVNGTDLGAVGPLAKQASLNEFLIPQRGIFVTTRAFLMAPKRSSRRRSEAAWPASACSRIL